MTKDGRPSDASHVAPGFELAQCHDLSAAEIDVLEDLIYEHNVARTGCRDATSLGFKLTGPSHELVGAIAGFTWAGFCEIRQFWVAEMHRGKGFGSLLLNQAVEEARARGCDQIYLATYTFQAPDFYARAGFKRILEIADKPKGHADVLMTLSLPTAV